MLTRSALALAAVRFSGASPVRAADPVSVPDAGPFALGVASGDPRPDGFILWTRVLGLVENTPIGWEIAEDEGFQRIVRTGSTLARAERSFAIHAEPVGLEAGRTYYYRFHLGHETSRTGRTATIDPQARRLRIALASCQHWEHGWFVAYRDMIAQTPDLLLHVGDYIYEKSFGEGPDVRSFGSGDPHTLDDYRARHALYRTDPDLQDAHAGFPMIATWDDHEVENDYAGLQGGTTVNPAAFVERRAAAYQAWFEHMPISPRRLAADGTARIFRRFEWGALASLTVLDCRQFRTPQPCGWGGQVIEGCPEALDPQGTMLGFGQERWLREQLRSERSRWSLIGQATLFSRLPLPRGGNARWSDIWDGYAASRARTVEAIRQRSVRNPILLSGDVHSFWANDVPADPERMDGPVVASEIVTSCLASRNGPESLFAGARSRNPAIRYLNNRNSGYVLLDLEDNRIGGEFRGVKDLTDPESVGSLLNAFEIIDRSDGVRIGS